MIKVLKMMEVFWFLVALAGAVYACYQIHTIGLSEGYVFLLVPFVAGIMFILRRLRRKSIEQENS